MTDRGHRPAARRRTVVAPTADQRATRSTRPEYGCRPTTGRLRYDGAATVAFGEVVGDVAARVRRSAQDYEEELRRRELAVGRALVRILPADRQVTVRELTEARRVLANALRDLRQLERQVSTDIQQLRNRSVGGRGAAAPPQRGTQAPAGNGGPDAARPRPGARLPRELPAYEAARDAIEDVLARWESREAQFDAEVQRRGSRKRRR